MTKFSWDDDTTDEEWDKGYMTEIRTLCVSEGVPLADVLNDIMWMADNDPAKVMIDEVAISWNRPITPEEKAENEQYEENSRKAAFDSQGWLVERMINQFGPDPRQWPNADKLKLDN